jgi:hypothetical protein
MKAVERGITLMRIYNSREEFTRDDDRNPRSFLYISCGGAAEKPEA